MHSWKRHMRMEKRAGIPLPQISSAEETENNGTSVNGFGEMT
jgi:hypothetical protein